MHNHTNFRLEILKLWIILEKMEKIYLDKAELTFQPFQLCIHQIIGALTILLYGVIS